MLEGGVSVARQLRHQDFLGLLDRSPVGQRLAKLAGILGQVHPRHIVHVDPPSTQDALEGRPKGRRRPARDGRHNSGDNIRRHGMGEAVLLAGARTASFDTLLLRSTGDCLTISRWRLLYRPGGTHSRGAR